MPNSQLYYKYLELLYSLQNISKNKNKKNEFKRRDLTGNGEMKGTFCIFTATKNELVLKLNSFVLQQSL